MDKPDWKQTQSVKENSDCLCACGGVCVYELRLTVPWKWALSNDSTIFHEAPHKQLKGAAGAPVCRDCVCVWRSLYVVSLQQPIFYLISSVTLQSAGTDQYGSVLLQDAILFSWQQSRSQVVHSQNSLLIAPRTPDCSMSWKTIVSLWYFSFPNICFGFALKSWMSLPPPQFHRITPIVQFCLI